MRLTLYTRSPQLTLPERGSSFAKLTGCWL